MPIGHRDLNTVPLSAVFSAEELCLAGWLAGWLFLYLDSGLLVFLFSVGEVVAGKLGDFRMAKLDLRKIYYN